MEKTQAQVLYDLGTFKANNSGSFSTAPDATLSPYSTPKSPVSVLSTDAARQTLSDLNQAQMTDMDRIARDNADKAAKAVTADKSYKNFTETAKKQGALSQEEAQALGVDTANYTYSNDTGLYMPKAGTTGNVQVDEANARAKKDQEEMDAAFNQQAAFVDASQKVLMEQIKSIYAPIWAQEEENNKRSNAQYTTGGIRGGSRYAGEVAKSIVSADVRAGLLALGDIASKEARALAEAQSASDEKRYALFEKKRQEVGKLREERSKVLGKIQEEALKTKKQIEQKKIQSSRDGAIASIVAQGVTDPTQILGYLNYNDAGDLIGDFTAKEVSETLKAIAPGKNLEKLTGETRNFFILKGQNKLPSNISSLPEEQQLFEYLKAQKAATTKETTSSTGRKDVITLSEARASKLPFSVVGMSEDEVTDSLYDPEPPAWFTEKLGSETGKTDIPEADLKSAWEEYRKQLVDGDSIY